ncbi:hypothetical protein [Collimonas sp.]|uniref:hypothetical protein n=1 Tax=Collimonas sp. TaxID=1963772 RepID=UPI0037C18287
MHAAAAAINFDARDEKSAFQRAESAQNKLTNEAFAGMIRGYVSGQRFLRQRLAAQLFKDGQAFLQFSG